MGTDVNDEILIVVCFQKLSHRSTKSVLGLKNLSAFSTAWFSVLSRGINLESFRVGFSMSSLVIHLWLHLLPLNSETVCFSGLKFGMNGLDN